ncbi:hypothetical protein L1987_54451 [Smallanthus sonchifolius]|uniref:Uncharacterized protein n=1 Tax=Smallanthus sonchifolius TaxID=185202 RepID=A0ACB9E6T2_9ASTR|nr:hypothetical protein L1987_54451 [Smallanthus sonchifolius]
MGTPMSPESKINVSSSFRTSSFSGSSFWSTVMTSFDNYRFPDGFVNEDGMQRIIRFPNRFVNEDPVDRSAVEVFTKFGDMLDKVATMSDSSTTWSSLTIIACSITITVVVLKCLMKKDQTIIKTYQSIPTTNPNNVSPISDQHIALTMPPVHEPVVSFSQFQGETMERFLQDIARERPISNGESSQAVASARVGTWGYVAPECYEGFNLVTSKCDVYSFGLLLLEIIGRRKNFHPNSNESIDGKQDRVYWTWKLYQKGKLSKFFLECGIEEENIQEAEGMLKVVFLCVHHDPKKRPTMSNVVKMLEGEKDIDPPSYPFEPVDSSVESKEKFDARSSPL